MIDKIPVVFNEISLDNLLDLGQERRRFEFRAKTT